MDGWAHDALEGNFKEVPATSGHLAMFATSRCNQVVIQLTERIRDWCHDRGVIPHTSLDIAASLALSMAASGLGIGPQFGPELIQRAKALDTAEGHLGLAIAAEQVAAYLCETMPPLGP